MRKTYRTRGVKEYWTARWDQISADRPMENHGVYPLKYAEMTVKDKAGKILEAGCGAGRILRYYHNHGYDIIGIDFIEGAINKLREVDPTLKVEVGDMLPSSDYAKRLKRVPKAWEKAFEVNAGESDAVRASCVEFVLAGLYAGDRISRSSRHGRITYEM